MTEVIYKGKSPEQRIQDCLRSSSPASSAKPTNHRASQAQTTTVPTRTITNIYYGASQAPKKGE
jgi:hypothetical protein